MEHTCGPSESPRKAFKVTTFDMSTVQTPPQQALKEFLEHFRRSTAQVLPVCSSMFASALEVGYMADLCIRVCNLLLFSLALVRNLFVFTGLLPLAQSLQRGSTLLTERVMPSPLGPFPGQPDTPSAVLFKVTSLADGVEQHAAALLGVYRAPVGPTMLGFIANFTTSAEVRNL